MRIAILGTRGVPAAYGGFETFAEELGARLASRGHTVIAYGRSHVVPQVRSHRGVLVRRLPTIRHKYLDTVVHTALSAVDALPRRYDVVLVCNNANAPFAGLLSVLRTRVALNVDGLEWQRAKWGTIGKTYYRICAWLAPRLPVVLISDAKVIADYYFAQDRAPTVYIPYGTDGRQMPPGPTLRAHHLDPGGYLLYVSRLEPENNAELVVEGYRSAGGHEALGVPLVLVGDAPYASTYRSRVASIASRTPGVKMIGYQFGEAYAELQSNCMVYVQATGVGGTHPALVEAMGRGAAIAALDVPEHREVLAATGVYFSADPLSLAGCFRSIVADAHERAALGAAARERALDLFGWESVTDAYERLFTAMVEA